MVSSKILAVLQLIGAVSALNLASSSVVDFERYKINALANNATGIFDSIQDTLWVVAPGLDCKLAEKATPHRVPANDDCQLVEQSLSSYFPTIECEGAVDLEKLKDNLKQFAPDNAPGNAPEKRQEEVRNRHDVDEEIRRKEQEAERDQRRTIEGCANANRPGNCIACAIAFTSVCIGEIGVCGAAAYGAVAASGGALFNAAWIAFSFCCVHAVANLNANLNGCWSR